MEPIPLRFFAPILAALAGGLPAWSADSPIVIVGGAVMNGNFNSPGVAGDVTHANTPYWQNIGTGANQSVVCLKDDEALDSTHNAVLGEAADRLHGLDTGYTIQQGDVFHLSYKWKDSFQWTDAGDQINIRLFITDTDLITGTPTDIANAMSGVSTLNDTYEAVVQNGILRAGPTHAGKKLFVALDTFNGGGDPNGYARIDDFQLTVETRVQAQVLEIPGNKLQLTWNAVPGCYYTVEGSADLAAWDRIQPHLLADQASEQAEVDLGGAYKFFRIRKELAGPMADPQTPTNALPVINVPAGGKWQLDFSDEFNGTAVDTTKWNIDDSPSSRAARPTQGINAWYWRPANVSVSGGNLVLDVTKQNSTTMWCGSINSNNKYEPTYGYVEARIEIADTTKSTHTAFWLQGDNMGNVDGTGNDGAEIDIFESAWFGDYTKSVIHIDGYAASHQANTVQYSTPGLHSGYHVFGIEWASDRIRLYYDGALKVTYTGKWVPQVAEYLWLSDGASFGDVGTFSTEQVGWLTSAKVDYIRFWKKL